MLLSGSIRNNGAGSIRQLAAKRRSEDDHRSRMHSASCRMLQASGLWLPRNRRRAMQRSSACNVRQIAQLLLLPL